MEANTDLEKGILLACEHMARELTNASKARQPYRVHLKIRLQKVVKDIDSLAQSLEDSADAVTSLEAKRRVDSLDRLLRAWQRANLAIERTVEQAISGKLDRRYASFSPIANGANSRECLRLRRLRARLAGQLDQAIATPYVPVSDQDFSDHDFLATPSSEPDAALYDTDSPAQPISEEPSSAERSAATYLGQGGEKENQAFQECVARFCGADELDRQEAFFELTRRYQHMLLSRLLQGAIRRDAELERILAVFWQNAETVLLEDYFFSARRLKLSHLLAQLDTYPVAQYFRRLLSIFHPPMGGYPAFDDAVASIECRSSHERTVIMRSLLVHPSKKYRHLAVLRLDPYQYWPIASFPRAPIFALADILDRLRNQDISNDYRKVFFDCTFNTLQAASRTSDVKAARAMVEMLSAFDFFLEDDYFLRLIKLNDIVELHENRLKIDKPSPEPSLKGLVNAKARSGARNTQLPTSFTEIPLQVQRKLAREGYYFTFFVQHPHPKIALETVPFINSPSKAEAALRSKSTNGHVVIELAKKDGLMITQGARMALLGNPHTQLRQGQKYIPQMREADLRRLAASHDINPEIGAYLRQRFSTTLPLRSNPGSGKRA